MKKRYQSLLAFGAILILVFGTALLSLKWYRSPTVKIGILIPISRYGRDVPQAAAMAIADVNARDASGYRFKTIIVDDKSRPAYAGRMAENLITKDHVTFLAGALNSEVALKITDISYKYKTIFLGTSHAATTLTMEDFQPYYFSFRQSSFQAMAAGALFLKDLQKTHPWRTLGFIGPDILFGHSAYEDLRYNLNRFHVPHTVVAVYWPALYTRDYDRFITSILRDSPDILVIELYGNDLYQFIRQGNRRGLFTRCRPCNFIGGGHYDTFRDLRDEMPLGMIVSGMNLINWPPTDRHKRFVERVRQLTGEFPSTLFTNTYSSILLLAEVVRTTGKPQDSSALVKALEGMKIELPSNPDGDPAYLDPLTHQLVQTVAVGEVVENRDFPPATRQGGHWKVYKGADLLAPADYVRERRKGGKTFVTTNRSDDN